MRYTTETFRGVSLKSGRAQRKTIREIKRGKTHTTLKIKLKHLPQIK